MMTIYIAVQSYVTVFILISASEILFVSNNSYIKLINSHNQSIYPN